VILEEQDRKATLPSTRLSFTIDGKESLEDWLKCEQLGFW